MEKIINIIMLETKDIKVLVNGEEKLLIRNDNRVVKADDIYAILNYSSGDTYLIDYKNDAGLDPQVISFFYELLKEIITRVNNMNSAGAEYEMLGGEKRLLDNEVEEDIPF